MESAQPADRIPVDQTSDDDRTPDDRTRSGGRAAGVPGRSDRSAKDMAVSLLVLLIPIALLLGFYRVFLDGDKPVVFDPAPAVAEARAADAFPVSEPAGLSGKWHVLSAQFARVEGGATLRIGYLAPSGEGLQLVQSSVPAERLLPAELTSAGRPQGNTELAGRSWQVYTAGAGQRALILLESNRTVIVVGSAGEEELRGLAGALH